MQLKLMRKWLLMLTALSLLGCTKVNSGVVGMFNLDTDLKIVLVAGKDINPDEKRTPSPLYIRMYELSSDHAFNKADFMELYEKDDALLGKDLLVKRELNRLVPEEVQEENFVLDANTRYVALFAEFYEYKNSKFKVIFPVTAKNVVKNSVRVEVTGNSMLLQRAR